MNDIFHYSIIIIIIFIIIILLGVWDGIFRWGGGRGCEVGRGMTVSTVIIIFFLFNEDNSCSNYR